MHSVGYVDTRGGETDTYPLLPACQFVFQCRLQACTGDLVALAAQGVLPRRIHIQPVEGDTMVQVPRFKIPLLHASDDTAVPPPEMPILKM